MSFQSSKRRVAWLAVFGIGVLGGPFAARAAAPVRTPAASKPASVDFSRDIRPILSKNCFACHGQDDGKRAAGLRLDLRDVAVAPRAGRAAAIVPGAPEKSALWKRITASEETRMPPAAHGPRLSAQQVAALKLWIRQGAPYAAHWAFVKPRRPALPAVRDRSWPRNPIDSFVLARLEKEGLRPAPEADRFVLLRRASLDLRGLPPTPEEVDALAKDTSPDAYEKAVDRFLADPAFGERWARMWLDLSRFADSAGYGSDPLRLNIWPYRDWVINAFNRDLSYDQFTIQQLAGDLLDKEAGHSPKAGQPLQLDPMSAAPLDPVIATAFHRNTMTNTEGGTDDEEWRVAAVKDRIDTTMQVWMGVTMGCAKCHSHKYDPITQKEYYRFFAVFNETADNDQPDESPTLPVVTPAIQEQIRQADAKIAEVKKQLEAAPAERKKPLQDQLTALEKSRPAPVQLPVMAEVASAQHRQTRLMVKGNYRDPADAVEPGVPAAFNAFPAGQPITRLTVARWLVDPENPLTARVAVNRFWAQLFGVGIVETEEDFGTQGTLPSHPQLLDWLACAFMASPSSNAAGMGVRKDGSVEGTPSTLPNSQTSALSLGWSMKKLLRLIVTSATYRQSSAVAVHSPQSTVHKTGAAPPNRTPARLNPETAPLSGAGARALSPTPQSVDSANRLLSRGPRYRLEAEMVRDQALALSGLLSRKIGGPSVYPPQPDGLWQAAFNGQRSYPTSTGEDRYRRGLYTFWRRTVPYPSMTTFDAPSREFCVVRRIRTNTPLQAFVTLNDPCFVECAQALARRLVKEGGATAEDRARFGLKLCLCRPAPPAQVQEILALYRAELDRYRGQPDAAKQLAPEVPPGTDAAEVAAWTVVANVLLNMDSVLTKG